MIDNPRFNPEISDVQRHSERLMDQGAASLSTAELMAIILRTATNDEDVLRLSERILSRFNGLHGLAQISIAELQTVKGLGNVNITQILAVLELGKRLTTYRPDERPIINSASEATRLVADMHLLQQEHVRVILLDLTRHVIAIPTIYIGTLNASVLRTSEVFREAILRNCPAMILVHNHPSGDANPSPEDVELTRSLVSAAKLLDITLVDHLIISQYGWTSLKELGLAFNR